MFKLILLQFYPFQFYPSFKKKPPFSKATHRNEKKKQNAASEWWVTWGAFRSASFSAQLAVEKIQVIYPLVNTPYSLVWDPTMLFQNFIVCSKKPSITDFAWLKSHFSFVEISYRFR